MKALLIAPGETPSLEPLASVTPAPLLSLLGAPLIAPLLQRLASGGVTDVVLVCPSRPSAYKRILGDGRSWGLNLAVLESPDADSVARTVQTVQSLGFHDETLAVIPANCWTDADWADLASRHRQGGACVSRITTYGVETGILFVDPNVSLASAPWRTIQTSIRWRPITNWAEYWNLAKESLENTDYGVAPRFAQAGPHLRLGPLARYDADSRWIAGPVWLGAGARVDPGAVLRGPVWVGADCRIGPGVTLESCVVEAGARLHGPLTLRNALVVANRAIDLTDGKVAILEEPTPEAHHDPAMTAGLLQLATRTARREQPVLRTGAREQTVLRTSF